MTIRPNILVILGTRPEAIKLAPVILRLKLEPRLGVRVAVTGQHREMLDQALAVFGLCPDHDLAVMQPGQTLSTLTSRLLPPLDALIAAEGPAAVLVQGDTTTAFAAALSAYYLRVPVGHVEAGLRTGDRYAPFPEEGNRRLISVLASWHFAPTDQARQSLLRESIADTDILVTGNTVIDALHQVLAATMAAPLPLPAHHRVLLVTAHRRENFGRLEAICRAICRIADSHPDVEVVFPVHLNPNVQESVSRLLASHPRIHLLPPLDYVSFVHLLARSDLVLTDSGGLQEEGPALGKPVLVLREVTERPEAVAAGIARLVGTDEDHIVESVVQLLNNPDCYAAMAGSTNVFGDGHASERIVSFLGERLNDL